MYKTHLVKISLKFAPRIFLPIFFSLSLALGFSLSLLGFCWVFCAAIEGLWRVFIGQNGWSHGWFHALIKPNFLPKWSQLHVLRMYKTHLVKISPNFASRIFFPLFLSLLLSLGFSLSLSCSCWFFCSKWRLWRGIYRAKYGGNMRWVMCVLVK